ncbi:MAG: hypothetical protein MRJ92_12865 [Nitrospira sp.]|nr:hypothetical protein [Nitrospira sp.]
MVYARSAGRRPSTTFISGVKALQCLYDDIAAKADVRSYGRPTILMKAKLKAESAVLAGEMSGHMFLPTGTSGSTTRFMPPAGWWRFSPRRNNRCRAWSPICHRPPVTPEIRVDCPDTVKFQLVDQVRAQLSSYLEAGKPVGASTLTMRGVVIDGVRAIFDDGW